VESAVWLKRLVKEARVNSCDSALGNAGKREFRVKENSVCKSEPTDAAASPDEPDSTLRSARAIPAPSSDAKADRHTS